MSEKRSGYGAERLWRHAQNIKGQAPLDISGEFDIGFDEEIPDLMIKGELEKFVA